MFISPWSGATGSKDWIVWNIIVYWKGKLHFSLMTIFNGILHLKIRKFQ